jgi:uncharacterized membrane protein YgdD (TMEM256/DUF423 family)
LDQGYREFEGKSFLAVSVGEEERASVIEIWESGSEYQMVHAPVTAVTWSKFADFPEQARQQAYCDGRAWFHRVGMGTWWVGYTAFSVAMCAAIYGFFSAFAGKLGERFAT